MRVVLVDDLPNIGLHRYGPLDSTATAVGARRSATFKSEHVKGKLVERVELRRVGPACHGHIAGRGDIYTQGGGLVHALLVDLQSCPSVGTGLRLVYLDREINAFVSIGIER
jgi:hypothetical protein